MVEDQLAPIIEHLLHETSPRSIRATVSIDQSKWEASNPNGSRSMKIDQTYIETASGRRYFDQVTTFSDGRAFHKASYCDGSQCANASYVATELARQQSIVVSNEFMTETRFGYYAAPPPLNYNHVGLAPLAVALPKAERRGEERVIGRRCDVFLFPEVKAEVTQSLVYSLDKATAVPLKVSAFKDRDHVRDQVPSWTWEAETLDEVSGYHIPLHSTYSTYFVTRSKDGRETAQRDMVQKIEIKEVVYDAPYPQSTFWPAPQPGVPVLDTLTKTATVPGGPAQPKEVARVATPIRAHEPGYGGWWSGAGVGLSLALLATAFVLLRRSR